MIDCQAIIEGIGAREIRQIAKALSLIENRADGYLDLLDRLYRIRSRQDNVVGITGMPGVGKSTLLASIVWGLHKTRKTCAIIAVDPTSRKSGGAFLGDRIRMDEGYRSEDVYFRSFASRGTQGGLCASALDAELVFQVAGYDLIFIETVGAGQLDLSVRDIVDYLVLLLVPNMGDEMQVLKGGIMEIPDLIAINKTDLGGADRLALAIETLLRKPVLRISAKSGQGVDDLLAMVLDGLTRVKKKSDAPTRLEQTVQNEVRTKVASLLEGRSTTEPYRLAAEIIGKITACLKGVQQLPDRRDS